VDNANGPVWQQASVRAERPAFNPGAPMPSRCTPPRKVPSMSQLDFVDGVSDASLELKALRKYNLGGLSEQ